MYPVILSVAIGRDEGVLDRDILSDRCHGLKSVYLVILPVVKGAHRHVLARSRLCGRWGRHVFLPIGVGS